MATKTIKKETLEQRADKVKENVKNLHDEVLNVSDSLVDASLSAGEKWQKLMYKAMKQGTVLFEKQQDLTLTTLEELKAQYVTGNKRFKKLIGMDRPKAKKAVKTKKKVVATQVEIIKDNLKVIDGIGPKIETLLNDAGITSFEQLAKADIVELKMILEDANLSFKFYNPTAWKKQAKMELMQRSN